MGTATLSSSHSLCGCGLAKSSLTRTRAMVRQPVATTATSACTQGLPGCSESCKAFPGTQKIAGRGQVRLSKRTVSTRRHAEAETSISQDSGDDKSASEEAAEPKILSQELGNVQSPASVWLPQPDTTDKVTALTIQSSAGHMTPVICMMQLVHLTSPMSMLFWQDAFTAHLLANV